MFRAVTQKPIRSVVPVVRKIRHVRKPKVRDKEIKYETKMAHKLAMKTS